MDIRFEKREHLQEKPDQKNLGFGKHFTDYMFVMDWDKEQGWHDAAIVPYGGIPMDPATMVLHYAQETFEGMKAYRTAEGKIQSDSFCRIPSANAVSADASAAMNSHILFRVPTKQCPGICTGRCTPHSTFLIERTKKHIILPFPPAFICFRKTWIPHFRRCSRMRMQCFTRRNRNEIRMLRKFYQNRN